MDEEFDLDFDDNVLAYDSGAVRRRKFMVAGAILVLLLVSVSVAGVIGGFVGYSYADSESSSPTSPSNSTPQGDTLWQQLSLEGIKDHLASLQDVANKNGGTRSISSTGFNASIQFIHDQLSTHTDYKLTIQPFTVNLTITVVPATFEQTEPTYQNFTSPYDFATLQFSGSGDVEEIAIPASNLGCNASDFENFQRGKIALIARGNCSFALKTQNAIQAGAAGVLIYNMEDQVGAFSGTLGGAVRLPVFGISYALGQQFLATPDAVLHMSYVSELRTIYTSNLIAETPLGDPDAVVIVGSHLDSVDAGPGLNDNGSGSSANLQMALQFAEVVGPQQVNKVRFMWYGAEEEGLLGSEYYVASLSEEEKAKVALNLNFDMLGSPNFIRGVLNGTDSTMPGSRVIMETFVEFFDMQSLTYQIIPFTGRSDYGPYLKAGIPAGGVETGAEVIKTPEERLRFGGLANAAYDPCYHQSCDTIENVDTKVLLEMAQAAAFALERFATTSDLTRVVSRN